MIDSLKHFIKPTSDIMLDSHFLTFKLEDISCYKSNKCIFFYDEEDIKKALLFLFKNQTAGWWSYSFEYVDYGICSKEQYYKQLMED